LRLIQNHDLLNGIGRMKRSRETGIAGTDNQQLGLNILAQFRKITQRFRGRSPQTVRPLGFLPCDWRPVLVPLYPAG